MPRPTTKESLIETANANFAKMLALLDAMTDAERNAEFNFGADMKQKEAHWARDKNLRDVLVHLYEWHQLLINWVTKNQNGENAPFIPLPYNWKTCGDMNVEFWEKHQNTPYTNALAMLKASHADVMALIEGFTNEELFTPKYFSYTGTSSLGSYCVSATASHYDWGMKKIKAHRKTYKQ